MVQKNCALNPSESISYNTRISRTAHSRTLSDEMPDNATILLHTRLLSSTFSSNCHFRRKSERSGAQHRAFVRSVKVKLKVKVKVGINYYLVRVEKTDCYILFDQSFSFIS